MVSRILDSSDFHTGSVRCTSVAGAIVHHVISDGDSAPFASAGKYLAKRNGLQTDGLLTAMLTTVPFVGRAPSRTSTMHAVSLGTRPSNGHFRLTTIGGFAEWMMTRRHVSGVETDEGWHNLRAQITRARASRVKATT
jgi:hypothetical protein